jgi:hypothetical protein
MKERSHEKMRKRNQKQMPLTPRTIDHPHAMELKHISRILDCIPTINELAWQDLTQHVATVGNWSRGNERRTGSTVFDCKTDGRVQLR